MALTKVTQHSLGNSAVTTAKLGTAPFGFANSSANVVYMAANGNVGIGTSAPSILMHVSQSNTGGDIGLLVSQGSTGYTNASSTATLYLGATGSLAQASRVVASHSDGTSGDHAQNLQFWTVNSGSTPTERMRIAANGNIGIGTDSPGNKLIVFSSSANTTVAKFGATNYGNLGTTYIEIGTQYGDGGSRIGSFNPSGNLSALVFETMTSTSGVYAERMRIDSDGYFLMAPTYRTVPRGRVDISAPGNSVGGLPTVCLAMSRWGDAGPMVNFFGTHESTSSIGNITNAGNTNTQYNTSSDYRLKQNITPMTGALAKVALLKPCTYTWKATGAAGQGFIAHELQAVVPDAVCGEKDAVNGDGSIQSQGVDTSYLVATLTAAIQELKAEFDAYKASHP